MPATKTKLKRRHKYCPVCEQEVAMSVMRAAKNENDLYWLFCPSCDSNFALTSQEYHKEKRPNISSIEKDNAKVYHTEQTYSIGELIYHPDLKDMGLIVSKTSPPIVDCSGAIVVSFLETGQKTLIEGYAAA